MGTNLESALQMLAAHREHVQGCDYGHVIMGADYYRSQGSEVIGEVRMIDTECLMRGCFVNIMALRNKDLFVLWSLSRMNQVLIDGTIFRNEDIWI